MDFHIPEYGIVIDGGIYDYDSGDFSFTVDDFLGDGDVNNHFDFAAVNHDAVDLSEILHYSNYHYHHGDNNIVHDHTYYSDDDSGELGIDVPIQYYPDDDGDFDDGGVELGIHYDEEGELGIEFQENDEDVEIPVVRLPSSFLLRTPIETPLPARVPPTTTSNFNEPGSSSGNESAKMSQNGGKAAAAADDGDLKNKTKDVNETDELVDGSCSICMEPWTANGLHSVCCLPCGHLYGLSCIQSWLQRSNARKCPQCNEVCGSEGIRKIYGLTNGVMDKELQEKINLLEAKCASLELKDADWCKKEIEWRQREALLIQQLKQGKGVPKDSN